MQRGNSFSLRLSQRIDQLIENHLTKNAPRELFIPGLDDGGKDGDIFDADIDGYDPADGTITPKTAGAKSVAPSEGTITGNVGTFQTGFNMLKVFIGIGLLATPSAFKLVGFVGGNIGMILIGIVAMYTMKLQIQATKKVGQPVSSYSELG